MKQIIDDLNWRYATKKFDPTTKISEEKINVIKEVLRLVPTSYGLQPLKYLFIESTEVRQQLYEHSYNQQQILDASHLLVICSYNSIEDEHVDSYMENTAFTRQTELENVLGFGDYIKKTIAKLSGEQISTWNAKQAYIALGQLVLACAQLRIDSTPMEGFDANGYDEVLGLNEKNLNATIVIPLGYRDTDDKNQHLKKVRKQHADLFETI